MSGSAGSAVQRGGQGPPRFDLGRAVAGARERGWPLVMGIVNVTPDSFSDGGQFLGAERAVEHALRLVEEGADLVDVGGESTRPGAQAVDGGTEMQRVVPVIEGIRRHSDVPVSVDTSKPDVMQAAAAAGGDILNDVRALREPGGLEMAASLGLPVILMHMQGQPRTMQVEPRYDDVVAEVRDFLEARVRACVEAGLDITRIAIDPGFGFGKTVEHNLTLLGQLGALDAVGRPVLVGLSRKSMIQRLLGRDVDERIPAGLALALCAAERGAAFVRTHDVAPTVDALRMRAYVEAAT